MKTPIFICIILGLLLCEQVNSQITPNVKTIALSEASRSLINKKLEQYTTFTLDKKELLDCLYQKGNASFRLTIDGKKDWTIELQFNDMRSPDYFATYETENGVFKYDDYVVNTFKGKTSDGKIARFTIDNEIFFGVIFNKESHFVIRQTKDFTHNETDESLIVYESSDLIQEENSVDYIEDAIKILDTDMTKLQNTTSSAPVLNDCPYYLAVATDADFDFYQNMGNNLNSTYNAIFTVFNTIEGAYESTFNIHFVVTFQNVYTSSNNPYNGITDSSNLLSTFRSYWQNNRTNVGRHIAHLFTGKNIDVNGIAYLGHIADNYAYGLSRDRLEMYKTTAHEIGHNLNAEDNPANCLCGTTFASVMCQGQKDSNLWFCDESINKIWNYMFIQRLVSICHYGKDTFGLGSSTNLSGSISEVRTFISGGIINSTQVITGGNVEYIAGTEIILSPGFKAQEGATFKAKIDDVTVCNPITENTYYACLYIMQYNASMMTKIPASIEKSSAQFEDRFKIYPNPNQGNFIIEILELLEKNAFIEISNLNGQIVFRTNLYEKKQNILFTGVQGVYVLKVFNGSNIYTEKIILK